MKLRTFGSLLLLACLPQISITALSAPLDHWEWRNPMPTGVTLRGIASGHERLVAVGDQRVMLSSTNGMDWEHSKTDIDVAAVAFGNGVFVVAGGGSTLLVSSNGVQWTQHDYGDGVSYSRISFHENRFFLMGYSDSLLISTNGIDWRRQQITSAYGMWWDAAARGNTTVAVGEQALIVSTNGTDWNEVDIPTTDRLGAVTWTTSKGFVAVGLNGTIVTSSNGLDWVQHSVAAPSVYLSFQAVREQGGVTVIAGSDGAIATSEGFELVRYFGEVQLNSLAHAWGAHWGVGAGGCIGTSTDGRSWVSVNARIAGIPLVNPLIGAVYGNDRFLAAGLGQAVVSVDGTEWGLAGHFKPRITRDVAFGNGRFVAVGLGLFSDPTSISSSTDGTNWTTHPSPYDPVHWERASFVGGKFIVVGRPGYLAVSTNGADWVFSNTNGWSGFGLTVASPGVTRAVHGNGKYVLGTYGAGPEGVYFTSDDGLSWSSNNVPNIWKFNDLVFGSGKFVAIGVSTTGGRIISSIDGLSWRDLPFDAMHLIFASGMFVAVAPDAVWSSTDAENWLRHPAELPSFPYGIAHGRDTFVIVGDYSGIVQSAPLSSNPQLTFAPSTGGARRIRLSVPGRYSFLLEASEDLVNWTAVGHFHPTNNVYEVTDPVNKSHRFYRAR